MSFFINNKAILSLGALVIAGMFLYNLLAGREAMPARDGLPAATIGNNLLEILNNLRVVTLDRNIFSDIEFLELRDFSTDIPSQPTGRPNPFNVIGQD